MGISYHLTCSNRSCKYSVKMKEGPGMRAFCTCKETEKDIINGEIEVNEEIRELLKGGEELECVTNYLCPTCKEWQNKEDYYIFVPTQVSPYGTIREYRMYYPFGNPTCNKCGNDLIHLLNPRSSKNKCPKCGADMIYKGGIGYYD